jgi:hypothetical protein
LKSLLDEARDLLFVFDHQYSHRVNLQRRAQPFNAGPYSALCLTRYRARASPGGLFTIMAA